MRMTSKDAAKTLQELKTEIEWTYPMNYQIALEMAINALKNERKEGTWEGMGYGFSDGELVCNMWACPNCSCVVETDDPDELSKYCPNCGVRLYVPKREDEHD